MGRGRHRRPTPTTPPLLRAAGLGAAAALAAAVAVAGPGPRILEAIGATASEHTLPAQAGPAAADMAIGATTAPPSRPPAPAAADQAPPAQTRADTPQRTPYPTNRPPPRTPPAATVPRPAPRVATRAPVAPAPPTAGGTAAAVYAAAARYVDAGIPYVWGGKTVAGGLDCSGFIWIVLRDAGMPAVPYRTSGALETWATPITRAQAQPGDLVFYYSPTSHVGVYAGGDQLIDQGGPGTGANRRTLWPGARFARIP